MVLADGSRTQMAVYEIIVIWNDEERAVPAYAGEGDALLGISLLRDQLGTFEFFPGSTVAIEPAE